MNRLKILLIAAEVAPYAKTGGLADVVSALGRALHRKGHDVRVFLPLYGSLREEGFEFTANEELQEIRVEYPGRSFSCGVSSAPLPNSERDDGTSLEIEFLDCDDLYHRGSYYTTDADEHLRWATLCRGALEAVHRTRWSPDVVHCNDWHTGLVPLYLRTTYSEVDTFRNSRTLLTIHNLAYQGIFGVDVIRDLGLLDMQDLFHQERLASGKVSYLETGILYASWISTVSETYAREIQGQPYGMGLDRLLAARADHLVGIVNGVDVDEWNPRTDPLIPYRYDADDLTGKARSKDALLERFGISTDGVATGTRPPMVLGIVSRLTAQKGFELLPGVLPHYLGQDDVRLVVLGSGERDYETYFQQLRDTYPDKVGVYFGYSDELAHWIEAGSDAFLMPSLFEPCGLNQMYSQIYGTVPIVRHIGGLADTVRPWDAGERTGTGFVFGDFSSDALTRALDGALGVWGDPDSWGALVRNAMSMDFSWDRQSGRYIDLYHRMLAA